MDAGRPVLVGHFLKVLGVAYVATGNDRVSHRNNVHAHYPCALDCGMIAWRGMAAISTSAWASEEAATYSLGDAHMEFKLLKAAQPCEGRKHRAGGRLCVYAQDPQLGAGGSDAARVTVAEHLYTQTMVAHTNNGCTQYKPGLQAYQVTSVQRGQKQCAF
jgi:hypothetical protein